METLLDSNYFNPLNDAFMHDEHAPLFDSDYLFETNDFPALPLLCRDNVMKLEMKPKKSLTGSKRKHALSKPPQRENEEPKFKAWPMEDPEQAGLYDEMKVLDDLFLFDNLHSKPMGAGDRPSKKQKTAGSRSKPVKKKTEQTKSKSAAKSTSKSSKRTSKSTAASSGSSPVKSKSSGVKLPKKQSGSKTRKVDSRNLLSPEAMDYRKAATGSRKRQRNRMKWSKDENMKLWESISKHGNNWTEIKKELACRTYYQIKDKGRRLLSVQGWISGRNKKYSHEAMYSAKLIAMNVLAEKKQGNMIKAAA